MQLNKSKCRQAGVGTRNWVTFRDPIPSIVTCSFNYYYYALLLCIIMHYYYYYYYY